MIGAMLDAERKVFVCIENQLIDPVKIMKSFFGKEMYSLI